MTRRMANNTAVILFTVTLLTCHGFLLHTTPGVPVTTGATQSPSTVDLCNLDDYLACFGISDAANISFQDTVALACGPKSMEFYKCLKREIDNLRPCPYLPSDLPQLNFTTAQQNPLCSNSATDLAEISECVKHVSTYDPYIKCIVGANLTGITFCRSTEASLYCLIDSMKRYCPSQIQRYIESAKQSTTGQCTIDWDYILQKTTKTTTTTTTTTATIPSVFEGISGTTTALQQSLLTIKQQTGTLEQLSQILVSQLKLAQTLAIGTGTTLEQTLTITEQQAETLVQYINSLVSQVQLAVSLS